MVKNPIRKGFLKKISTKQIIDEIWGAQAKGMPAQHYFKWQEQKIKKPDLTAEQFANDENNEFKGAIMNAWITKIRGYLRQFIELGVLLIGVSVFAEILSERYFSFCSSEPNSFSIGRHIP